MSVPQASEYLQSREKRVLDIAVAGSVGVLAMTGGMVAESLIIAGNGLIKPVFKQKRVGRSGELFSVFKFRSWDYGGNKLKGADVVRRLGLDESPQFINVFLGKMSAIGYRPITARDQNHAAQRLRAHFAEDSPYHPNSWLGLREQAKPGITGATQNMPLRPDAGSLDHLVDVVRVESEYLTTASFLIDLDYLLKTPQTMVLGHNPTVAKSYLQLEID